MKDRYLFRGKRLDSGEWIVGYLDMAGQALINTIDDCKVINPETIGQCTGLKDKNGVLIFEGDIIDFQDEGTASVLYSVESSEYLLNFGDSVTEELKMFHADKLEITGSIHDEN